MRIVAGIEGFVIINNGLIGLHNSMAWSGATMWITSAPAWDYANQIAADRKARQAEAKKAAGSCQQPQQLGTSTTPRRSSKA